MVQALDDLSITEPTPIQQAAIPMLLDDAVDFLGLAQTGTGKTAAFGLPLIEQIEEQSKGVQAIILSPTRELAQQLSDSLKSFVKHRRDTKIAVVYGGANIANQIKTIQKQKPQIIVATPGRMIDLIKRKVLNLTNVRFVVLDEADEMLNMGFKEDIETILSFTQHDKNIWLFSATMPKDIRQIVNRFMDAPKEISVKSEEKVNQNIEHRFAVVKPHNKMAALQRIIELEGEMYALIFCRTKAGTQKLATTMASEGYAVEAIHGDLSQAQRDMVMRKFKSGNVKLLAATDVAARGIDVDNLTHVIHYDMPDDLAYYTHRSGRTGRAGKSGAAIALIAPRDHYKINNLERQLSITFKKHTIPSMEEVLMKNVQGRIDDIISVEASEDALAWAFAYTEALDGVSKEDLLAKMITKNLESINKDRHGDLNATAESSRGDRSRGDRSRGDRQRGDRSRGDRQRGDRSRDDRPNRKERAPRGERFQKDSRGKKKNTEQGMVSFKINLGKSDDIQKGDLLKIICDSSGVRSKHIGRIDMYDRSSNFDVREEKAGGFENSFSSVKLEGRKVQVNKA